jgi:hypothetical protein
MGVDGHGEEAPVQSDEAGELAAVSDHDWAEQHELESWEIQDAYAQPYVEEGSDEQWWAGPLVDNWEISSDSCEESLQSGRSIDMHDPSSSGDIDCGQSKGDSGSFDAPKYELLQHSLVTHMKQHSLLARERRKASRSRGWAQAAHKGVINSEDAVSVLDYSFEHACMYREDVQSRLCADRHLLSNAYGQFMNLPEPDPAGIENCYPPSVAAVMAVLGVPELEIYEVHFCSKGCIHWWFHMPGIAEHYQKCSLRGGCAKCLCPHCHTCRFVKDKKGIHGAMRCWFFFDCLQTKALDPEWSTAVLNTQADRSATDVTAIKASFAKEPAVEMNRVLRSLPDSVKKESVRPCCSCIAPSAIF